MSIDETSRTSRRSQEGTIRAGTLTADLLEKLTIPQIRELAEGLADDVDPAWGLLEKDARVGVRQVAVRHRREMERCQAEQARQQRLLQFERRFWGQGMGLVAGVDEAGRGCLAGPVVAGAVILPQEVDIPGLDDSKKLSPEKREKLFEQIPDQALAVGIGQIEAGEIDQLNILQASLKAMRQALERLGTTPQKVLIDGNTLPGSPFPEVPVVDGDARCLSIAAASVVAKVHRDRLMIAYDSQYPGYGFADHKGYGSAAHLAALREHGPCPLHRRSFGPVAELVERPSALFLTFRDGLAACQTIPELESLGQFIKEGTAELQTRELEQLRQLFRRQRHRLSAVGARGEDMAADFLTSQGYRLLARRYRAAGGEIDLIVRQGDELVFVEVKTSGQNSLGPPEERVDAAKRKRLTRAARHYLLKHADSGTICRFDVVAVILTGGDPEIEHLEDAFRP